MFVTFVMGVMLLLWNNHEKKESVSLKTGHLRLSSQRRKKNKRMNKALKQVFYLFLSLFFFW